MMPLMSCGHIAQTKDEKGRPICGICAGINPGATELLKGKIPLNDRFSLCVDCGKKEPSSWLLPFFEYRPTRKNDLHYCGCSVKGCPGEW
jgi:hypothetical protein